MNLKNKVFLSLQTILTLGVCAWTLVAVYFISSSSPMFGLDKVRAFNYGTTYMYLAISLVAAEVIGLVIILAKRSKRWMMIVGSVYNLISVAVLLTMLTTQSVQNYIPLYIAIPSLALGHAVMIFSIFMHGTDVELA